MPAHKAPAIQLSAEQEAALSALVRAHSTPQKLAERARIILLAATGKGMGEGRVPMSGVGAVGKWPACATAESLA